MDDIHAVRQRALQWRAYAEQAHYRADQCHAVADWLGRQAADAHVAARDARARLDQLQSRRLSHSGTRDFAHADSEPA